VLDHAHAHQLLTTGSDLPLGLSQAWAGYAEASPLRAHGRQVGDPDLINLLAGHAQQLAQELSAEEITASLGLQADAAIFAAGSIADARWRR